MSQKLTKKTNITKMIFKSMACLQTTEIRFALLNHDNKWMENSLPLTQSLLKECIILYIAQHSVAARNKSTHTFANVALRDNVIMKIHRWID